MAKSRSTDLNDKVDPEIRRFVDMVNASYAAHDDGSDQDHSARRRVAELVRRPWREGGPVMTETLDMEADGLRLRLYRPVADRPLPVMLYIHGGGWTLFSIDTHDRLMREYAAGAGVAVLGIEYSLSPEHKFPVALDQCSAAIDWIADQGEALGLDASRIVIGGDSAGANLAVATCLLRRDRDNSVPIAMLLNYGAFAPEHSASYDRFGNGAYSLEPEEMDAFWDNYVDDPALLAEPLVAPLRAKLEGLPPAFVAIAECDILADCNRAFAARLAEAGVPVEAVLYRGATHSFLEAMSISGLARRAIGEQSRWISTIAGDAGRATAV